MKNKVLAGLSLILTRLNSGIRWGFAPCEAGRYSGEAPVFQDADYEQMLRTRNDAAEVVALDSCNAV